MSKGENQDRRNGFGDEGGGKTNFGRQVAHFFVLHFHKKG